MSVVFWCIPLYVFAVAIAVTPLLHGSLRLNKWEQERAASLPAESALSPLDEASLSSTADGEASRAWARLEHARSEALSLLGRLEELKDELTSLEDVAVERERTKHMRQAQGSLSSTVGAAK
jgi:hypothetical protein